MAWLTLPADEDGASPLQMPRDVTEKGTALVEEFLRTWAARSAALGAQARDGMDVDGEPRRKVSPQEEMDELRRTVDEFRPRCENDPWVRAVLESF